MSMSCPVCGAYIYEVSGMMIIDVRVCQCGAYYNTKDQKNEYQHFLEMKYILELS